MPGQIDWLQSVLKKELGDMYGEAVWQDQQETIKAYAFYDGTGQSWDTKSDLDYTPTKMIVNQTKYLIDEIARFMLSRAPEISIMPTGDDDENKKRCKALEDWLRQTLEDNGWAGQLSKAARDAFIGKRIALKVSGSKGQPPMIRFRPSLEFSHDVNCDTGETTKILYYYHQNNETEPTKQRTWLQKYWLEDGRCYMSQGIYDGNGLLCEDEQNVIEPYNTGLDFIPSAVIINDGLTGDILGESHVQALQDMAITYNRRMSDDQDALKFNMFPQRVFVDASEESMKNAKFAPGAMIDLQTEPTAVDSKAQYGLLEARFGYSERFEAAMNRLIGDMHKHMSVPQVTVDQLKSLGISGKAMKALYWGLITRCEEKWSVWDTAIRWMVRALVSMGKVYGIADHTAAKYTIVIEHLYPIPDDEEDERRLDLQEVNTQTRSRDSYIEKWQPNKDAKSELQQMAVERQLLEEGYFDTSLTGKGG